MTHFFYMNGFTTPNKTLFDLVVVMVIGPLLFRAKIKKNENFHIFSQPKSRVNACVSKIFEPRHETWSVMKPRQTATENGYRLGFRIYEEEGLYFICRKINGADQLRCYRPRR